MKINNLSEKYLQPLSIKISNQKDLKSISAGLTRILPLTIIGSLFFLIANFPIESYKNFLLEANLTNALLVPFNITFGMISIYATFFIAYSRAETENLDAVLTGIMAIVSFLILTPITSGEEGLSLSLDWLGSRGLFVAILVGILITRLYGFIVKKNWVIKMPDGVPPFVEKSFSSLIPATIIAILMTIIAFLFTFTSYQNIHGLIFNILQIPLMNLGGSFGAFLFAYVLIQILWWFGIHGMNVVGSIMTPIWLGLDATRLAQIQAGEEITTFVGQAFVTAIGGPALAVTLTFLIFAKSKQLKAVSKIALPAAIFNIAEPVNFGIPTVMNPMLFLPIAIIIPIVNVITLYSGMALGLLSPLTGVQVPQQVPRGIWGFVQGNWSIGIWQILTIILNIAILYPFAKAYDQSILKKEAEIKEVA